MMYPISVRIDSVFFLHQFAKQGSKIKMSHPEKVAEADDWIKNNYAN